MTTTTSYPGIDYSGHGAKCNRDESGIRYGIISANDMNPDALAELEPDYGDAHCPKCGNEALDCHTLKGGDALDEWERAKHECEDYACANCEFIFGSESAFSDEPLGHYLDSESEKITLDSSNDVWVIKSPYFTYAQFCSPCAPGACHLGSPLAEPCEANACYCLGHSWFSDNKAPYTVYAVDTGEEILPS